MKQFLKLFFIFLIIAVLPACGPHYQKQSLSHLRQTPASYKTTQDDVTVEVRKLTQSQTKSLFDGQGKHLNKLGAQPLYFKIINDSDKTFLFNSNDITLTALDPQIIERALSKSYLPMAGSFFKSLIPLAGSILLLNVFVASSHPLLALVTYPTIMVCAILIVFVGAPVSIGRACYSSYQTKNKVNEYNECLAEDITEKNIPKSLKIPADTACEFLFFTDATQFKNNFQITLIEKITQQPLTFNVTL